MTASTSRHSSRVTRLYRLGTIVFLGASVLIAGVVGLFAFSTTAILVTIEPREISRDLEIEASAAPVSENQVKGAVLTAAAQDSQTIAVSSDGPSVDDYSRGTVTIENHWTQVQPLAAGTRLKAASNGQIYRTQKRIDVPAGGSVKTEIVCDCKGSIGDIDPDSFTIVALWPGLQAKIFGTTAEPTSGGTRQSGSVTQAAIDAAIKDMETALTKNAREKLADPTANLSFIGDPVILRSTVAANAKAGEEKSKFTVAGSVTIGMVAVDNVSVVKLASTALQSDLREGEAPTLNAPTLTWTIASMSEKNQTAKLTLTAEQSVQLNASSGQLSPSRFTSKSRTDVIKELRAIPGVTDAAVAISPFWSDRTPGMASRITVTLQP